MTTAISGVLRRAQGLATVVLLGVCLCALPAAAQQLEEGEPYRIAPGDVVLVSVFEDPELNAEALVLPDGRVSLPVAGTVMAGGRTPEELARVVRRLLAGDFVEPPSVTVSVRALAPEEEDEFNSVFVLGEVARPGAYQYDPEKPITVLKALTLAGGLGPFAARQRIQVREEEGGMEVLRVFDYDAIEEGFVSGSRDLATLRDGAVIVVPERGLFE